MKYILYTAEQIKRLVERGVIVKRKLKEPKELKMYGTTDATINIEWEYDFVWNVKKEDICKQ